MCGIAGIVNYAVEQPDDAVIRKMMDVMRHRGPDGEGIYIDRHVAFGHVRLSIIDVEGSSQPLSNEDGKIWVTFNGEIYNYRELRKKLISLGHCFKTNGDTETLVHLYEEYGSEMTNHLIGMFAFAIWDSRNQLLLLVRDRMGIKPLYYFYKGDDFIFGSEPKAILQHPKVSCRPSDEGIWHYLTYRSVPALRRCLMAYPNYDLGIFLFSTERVLKKKLTGILPYTPNTQKRPVKAKTLC